MHTKKYIKLRFFLKSMGSLRFVPPVIFDILLLVLPLKTYFNYGSGEKLEQHLLLLTQFFMPLFSVWWVVFTLREYLESDGNELFFTGGKKVILKELLMVFLLAMGNILLLFVIYFFLQPNFSIECARIISVCVFYFGLTYGIAFFVKSVSVILLSLLLYTLLNFTIPIQELVFPFYMSRQLLTIEDFIIVCLPLLLIGILLSVIGFCANKKLTSYY